MDARVGFTVNHEMVLEEAIEFAADSDFDFVEVKMHGSASRTALDRKRADVVKRLAAHDLDLLVHLPYQLDIGSPHEHVREGSVREIEACLECAGALGAEKAVIHAESRAWIGDRLRTNVFESLNRLDRTASRHGIELCAENPLRSTIPITDFEEVFAETEVSMTLDTGHARCDGVSSAEIASFVAAHADRISHFHLNDTRGRSDEHLPFGTGTVDFDAIFGALPDAWQGTLDLEIGTADFGYITTSKQRLDELLAA